MAGIGITYRLDELNALGIRLKDAMERARDTRPLADAIGAYGVASTRKRFEEQRGPDGKKWAALSADTVLGRLGGRNRVYTKKMKFRKGVAARMGALKALIHKGHLRNSITKRVIRTGVEWGSNMKYARLQHKGGSAGRRSARVQVPARPHYGINAADQAAIKTLGLRHLKGALT